MKKILLTHKGWFGFCPVYFAELDSEAPFIEPRHPLFSFLFTLSEMMFASIHWFQELINPYAEQFWVITVTGELEEPIEISIEEEDA